jgi:plastocyanin
MARRIVTLAGGGLIVLSLLAAAGVAPPAALAGDPCFHQTDNRPAVSAAAVSRVTIDECSFGPTAAWVPVGSEVTWRNVSSQGHEVVGSNLTWGAHDKILAPGDQMGWTFERAGVYGYSCMIHPGMTGVVVVGDASMPATAVGAPASAAPASAPAAAGEPAPAGWPGWLVAAGVAAAVIVLVALAAVRRGTGTDRVSTPAG